MTFDTKEEHRFDVAISFAGEQRHLAEQINAYLRSHNIRTFYDEDHVVELWGKNLAEHLPTIYSHESRLVLMIASEEYFKKVWTKVERRAAISRMIRRDEEYLLIYKVGDVAIPMNAGISPDLGYLSDDQFSAEQVGKLVLEKLGLKYSNDEVFEKVVEFANRRIYREYHEQKFYGGFVPILTFVDEMRQMYPDTDERWSLYLRGYLDQGVAEGYFQYQGGLVIGYRVKPGLLEES